MLISLVRSSSGFRYHHAYYNFNIGYNIISEYYYFKPQISCFQCYSYESQFMKQRQRLWNDSGNSRMTFAFLN